MLTKIRCFVVRVPEEEPATPPRAAWREALPWADPYILGLIRKLQQEVKVERAAQAMVAKEMTEEGYDFAEWDAASDFEESMPEQHVLEQNVTLVGREQAAPPHEHPAAAAAGSPPSKVVIAEHAAEDEEGRNSPTAEDRSRRRPR